MAKVTVTYNKEEVEIFFDEESNEIESVMYKGIDLLPLFDTKEMCHYWSEELEKELNNLEEAKKDCNTENRLYHNQIMN